MDYSYTIGDYSSLLDPAGDGGPSITDQEFFSTVVRQNDSIVAHQDQVIDGLKDQLNVLNDQKDFLQTQVDHLQDLHVTENGQIDYSQTLTDIEARLHNLQTINHDILWNGSEIVLFAFVAIFVAYCFNKFLSNTLRF